MITAFRSEIRKILSVRSTYIFLAISMAMELLFAFYLTAWRATGEQLASPHYLSSQVVSAINPLMLFGSLVGILLVTHEYRYNTIMYTLTAARSRTKVLVAKLLAVTLFALIFTFVFGLLSPLLSLLAIKIHGLHLGHQEIAYATLAARSLFAGWAFMILGFILAVIIRAQVGALVTMFLLPGPVEAILGLLLKKNAVYLPFSANNTLLDIQGQGAHISYTRAALVVSIYIVVGWIVAWYLFLKRDAA